MTLMLNCPTRKEGSGPSEDKWTFARLGTCGSMLNDHQSGPRARTLRRPVRIFPASRSLFVLGGRPSFLLSCASCTSKGPARRWTSTMERARPRSGRPVALLVHMRALSTPVAPLGSARVLSCLRWEDRWRHTLYEEDAAQGAQCARGEVGTTGGSTSRTGPRSTREWSCVLLGYGSDQSRTAADLQCNTRSVHAMQPTQTQRSRSRTPSLAHGASSRTSVGFPPTRNVRHRLVMQASLCALSNLASAIFPSSCLRSQHGRLRCSRRRTM